jgi:hypothetical protein
MSYSTTDLELAIRYAIPGTLAVMPTSFYLYRAPSTSYFDVFDLIVALALLVIPVGYIFHQSWFWLFNSSGIAETGYCRYGRYNLREIYAELRVESRKNAHQTLPPNPAPSQT